MSKYLFLLLLLFGITATANAQDMMLNGSFEECDGTAPAGSDPYSIYYGAYWSNLTGTADLVNPCVPEISGTPCFGVGCGRFGLNANGYVEYMYGQTLPLTAGQIYEVSFWIKKDYWTETERKVGLAITETVPTPSITSTTPLISQVITSTQCVKLKACFTAQSNVTHYVTIGPFGGGASPEPMLYMVDSVSVKVIPSSTPLPVSHTTASKPLYCMGDQVLLDGSASANETSYEWKIYYLNTAIYSSGVLNGQAGTLNATNLLAFMEPGACYRAELTTYGVCKDVSSVEFCFAEINVDFISDGSPVCENIPRDLQVTGDNGWIYTWSTGQTGVGLKNVTVTPTIGNSTYNVTVTTPEGCMRTVGITLNVNSQNNVAPWMDGINGTGEYTYYVSQGQTVNFTSTLFNDHLNEELQNSGSWTIPSNLNVTLPTISGSTFSFSWATSMTTPTGEYHFYLTSDDQNACGSAISVFDFKIVVICDQCKVCVGFEDRIPGGIPLPPETKTGQCIFAALTDTVSTGDANVLFQAGVSIVEGPHFYAGPGYEAVIDPATCITDCEDCCTDWNGFTYDELPNPVYLNLQDDDPTNDLFQLTDVYHPFCAFGAKSYHLEILVRNAAAAPVNSPNGMSTTRCCAFESPAPENPIPHSSIWWDGYTLDMWGNYVQLQDGTLTYTIDLYGCNGETITLHGDIEYRGTPGSTGLAQDPNSQNTDSLLNHSLTAKENEQLQFREAERKRLDQEVNIFPNPTTNVVQVSGIGPDEVSYQVFDEKGRLLSRKEKTINQSFSLSDYSKGTYYIRIYSDSTYVVRKVIKM